MNWLKRTMEKIKNPEANKKLQNWQSKYDDAKTKYDAVLKDMNVNEDYYEGSKSVYGPNKLSVAPKQAINVRNIVYELIESQVDTSVPMPKVTAIHEEDEELANRIEKFLENEVRTLGFKAMNDLQERIVPVQGGDFFLIEWDSTKGTHCTIGDLAVSTIHPRNVIPQPGVVDVDKMDYIFTRTSQTKEYVKLRFGKDVSQEDETDAEIRDGSVSEDLVTVITAYYKNKEGGIGLYRWCGDVMLEDMEDYQARQTEVCEKCGKPRMGREEQCECGSKKWKKEIQPTYKIMVDDTKIVINPMTGVEEVKQTEKEVDVEYYKPSGYPLILRKNISKDRYLLGTSDVNAIRDQQETVKKLGSQINEKLLMAGSFMVLPEGLGVELTDEQYKVIRVKDPAQKASIDVLNAQVDCSQDRVCLEENYQWAKSTLGITDSFQGKYDSSALSGTAKQYSINQAAGRLESKRVMKNAAYSKLYEMMFKFALAYADEPMPIISQNTDGSMSYAHFDRQDFLKIDAAGEFYWDDEFIFETDPTSTLMVNREAMWNQADMKLQSGAFGPLGDMKTAYLYWLEQERNDYPHAAEIKGVIEERLQEQLQQEQMMQQQMQAQQQGGMPGGMPGMPM